MAKTNNTIGGNGGPTRVAFYTRISTDEDQQKYSLGAQSERLEAFCKAQYGETGGSTSSTGHRVGTHMNRRVSRRCSTTPGPGRLTLLLVFRVDRLSRKVRELALMVDDLTKNGSR